MQGKENPKAEDNKGDDDESGKQRRKWNLRIIGFPQEGSRSVRNEAIIKSITEESSPDLRRPTARPTSPA